jgi:hypothetical protein
MKKTWHLLFLSIISLLIFSCSFSKNEDDNWTLENSNVNLATEETYWALNMNWNAWNIEVELSQSWSRLD